MKKKILFEYKTTEWVIMVLQVILMPMLVFFLADPFSTSSIGYIGLWLTILLGFTFIHIKLRYYYDLIFEGD